jgi:hypothetical protein
MGNCAVNHPQKRGNDVSNICRLLPKLTVNGQFMRDFIAEESPCFALGLVEERKQACGFSALRPAEVIPPEISGLGFNFGHALLGTTEFEVMQFVFHFYGFETYNMLVNPNNNNRLVKKVLMRMVESGDYFFFAISPKQSVTAFRSEIGQKHLAGLSTNLRQIQGSTTTDAQYQRALAQFRRRPDPPGQVLDWVCRDNLSYLDLTQNRLEWIRINAESHINGM